MCTQQSLHFALFLSSSKALSERDKQARRLSAALCLLRNTQKAAQPSRASHTPETAQRGRAFAVQDLPPPSLSRLSSILPIYSRLAATMSQSDDEDDGLGFSLGLGLGGVLQDAGVDVAAFSSFFGSSEADPSGTSGKNADGAARLAEIEGEDDDGKYMDDDDDLGASGLALAGGEDAEAEREARARAQAKEKAEQEEWMRRGLEMQREAEQKAAAKRRKLNAQQRDGEGKKEETPLEVVRRMWPGWQPGDRLRMSQVFYQTPVMEEREWREGLKRKRRHFGIGMDTPEEQAKEEPIPEPKKCECRDGYRSSGIMYGAFLRNARTVHQTTGPSDSGSLPHNRTTQHPFTRDDIRHPPPPYARLSGSFSPLVQQLPSTSLRPRLDSSCQGSQASRNAPATI